MNDYGMESDRLAGGGVPGHVDELAIYKRRSLESQALWAAWELGALLRRIEVEAPGAGPALREAIGVLTRLGGSTRPVARPRRERF